ncbi:MAG: hypothetical protein CVU89_12945 [Firmicutes bacterium HGW-Firmicutes-14]|nr:MAG: hypothetical protein CVU89_12945 [Firmicutes bacterium HGW-Firmicutes-14]
MDLITHGLMGSMMAGAGLQEKFGIAGLATMVISNIAPDLDIVAGLKGPKTFYKYHREITHSLLGAGVLWVLITLGVYFFTPLDSFWAILAMVGAGLAGHLLIDSLTPWGLPLFYPFSSKKYGLDLIWFFDPVIISLFVGGVYLGLHYPVNQQLIYVGSFAFLLLYLFLRVVQKRKACRMAEREVTPRFRSAETYVLPSAVNPFMWDVIYKARSQYLYVSVDTLRKEVIMTREFTSSHYHRCIKHSCRSDLVDVFLKRARFPFYNMTRENGCYVVEWCDVQLLNLGGVHGITVVIDESGQISAEKLMIKKPVRRRKKKIEDYLQEEVS